MAQVGSLLDNADEPLQEIVNTTQTFVEYAADVSANSPSVRKPFRLVTATPLVMKIIGFL
jgi:hypothetical protein